MKNLIIFFAIVISLAGCTSQSNNPTTKPDERKKLMVVVEDYSKSYRGLVEMDSQSVHSLFLCGARTGASVAHIAIQSYSNLPVYITRIERLDTTHTASKNIYQQARERARNSGAVSVFNAKIELQVADYLQEANKYAASSYTDLQYSLDLAKNTACAPLYTQGDKYDRYVLILSDVLSDPPHRKSRHLTPVDFCGATVLIVRPSPTIPSDSLRIIFSGAQVYTFSNLPDAISFINEQ